MRNDVLDSVFESNQENQYTEKRGKMSMIGNKKMESGVLRSEAYLTPNHEPKKPVGRETEIQRDVLRRLRFRGLHAIP